MPRPAAPSAPPFVVSTPRPQMATAKLSDSGHVAWVALQTRSIANADDVTIRVESSGQTVTAKAIDGGLDPVPVRAALGDQLELTVTKRGNSDVVLYNMVVTESKGPVVIRTSPPPMKRDVPLNAVIVIVFSEPLSAESVKPGVVSLTRGSSTVAGQLSFADSTHVAELFVPNAPLAPATDYTLNITQGIKNVDGQVLREPVVVQFTTTDSSSVPPPTPFVASGPHMNGSWTDIGGNRDVVWVALPAGTIANADRVNVVAKSPDGTPTWAATGKVSDGGLDPLPVAAVLGDQLQVTEWTDSMAVIASFNMSVAGSKGPVVVRTSPSKLKRDVPPNALILVVFSEPLSLASVAPGTMSLASGGAAVAGKLSFDDSSHLAVLFTPDAPLTPATDYTLNITQGVKNVDGQVLREPAVVQFTTAASTSAAPSGVVRFHVSGTVTDDSKTPVPGASIQFWISPLPGQLESPGEVFLPTDGDGKFTADLNSIAGSASGPPGTADAIAVGYASKDGYTWDSRYVLASGISDLRFKLYRRQWVTPGDSVLLTVTPDDGVCLDNGQDAPPSTAEWRCRTIFVPPSTVDGTLSLSIQPCQTACLGLYAEMMDAVVNGVRIHPDSTYVSRFGNSIFESILPATGALNVPMLRGFPLFVQIEVPWSDSQAETVWLRTSFTPAP
jgi:hypothetical protein